MKQKKKEEETKVYEIWPNITVRQLAGKFIMNLIHQDSNIKVCQVIEASELTIIFIQF